MNKKKLIILCSILMGVIVLGIGTIAYFRRSVSGTVTSQTGNLVLIVNEADAVLNETFRVSINRSEEEPFVLPDDSGVVYLNIVSTGSSADVSVVVNLLRSNLPENLKFYVDEQHKTEYTTFKYMLEKADVMEKTVPIYWYWDGSVDSENDSLFIGEVLEASVNVTASFTKPFVNTLIANAKSEVDIDFSKYANYNSNDPNNGLLMRSGTENEEYPIVYYRGKVSDNSVRLDDICWLIIRTTETGGIKLLYNGPANSDGSCNSYVDIPYDSELSFENSDFLSTKFNTSSLYINNSWQYFDVNTPVAVGYMYNNDNLFIDSGTLDASGYRSHLNDNSIDSETGHYNQNKYDSTVKSAVDKWYEDNIKNKSFSSLLEDSVWCNDRSVTSTTYSVENYATNSNRFNYSAYTRGFELSEITPSLSCRLVDSFTVDRANGNGDLTYPIGLLTVDEYVLSGYNFSLNGYKPYTQMRKCRDSDCFETYSGYQKTLSPLYFTGGRAYHFELASLYGYVDSIGMARPSIVLSNLVEVLSGEGTFANPYILG